MRKAGTYAVLMHDAGLPPWERRRTSGVERVVRAKYVVGADGAHTVRDTTIEEIIAEANKILHPYTLEMRSVAWTSVYEVGCRLTDKFDDVPLAERGGWLLRVFITGDACHTNRAKAGNERVHAGRLQRADV